MQVLLAHPGTQHARRLAQQLERCALLGEYWTGLAFAEQGIAARTVTRLRGLPRVKGLSNRIVVGVLASKLHCVPGNEIRAIARLALGGESLEVLHRRNRIFQDAIPDSSIDASDAVIAFDTSAWRLARRARDRSRPLFLDRTIGHPTALARIEAEVGRLYPEWGASRHARPDYVVAAEAEEHDLARRIVTGSDFARDTLLAEGLPAEKLRVNPYGVDWTRFGRAPVAPGPRPLRFLFLGSHVGRKGLPVLLDAWRSLGSRRGDAELWLAGYCGERERRLIPALPGLRILGLLSHQDLPATLGRCDVLVLPTFFEGFTLTLLESLAAGLRVISTPNSGGREILARPELGRLIPAGSVDALVAALAAELGSPPDRAVVRAAAASLADAYSWDAYGDRWSRLLREDT